MPTQSRIYRTPPQGIQKAIRITLGALEWTLKATYLNGVLAVAPSTWRSFGEEILITYEGQQENVTVSIESGARFQLLDWGKSKENVKNFFTVLESIMR